MTKDEVKFTEMKYGDKEDYDLLANFEDKYIEGTADRIVRVLQGLDKSMGGYKVSRLVLFLISLISSLFDKTITRSVFAISLITLATSSLALLIISP